MLSFYNKVEQGLFVFARVCVRSIMLIAYLQVNANLFMKEYRKLPGFEGATLVVTRNCIMNKANMTKYTVVVISLAVMHLTL